MIRFIIPAAGNATRFGGCPKELLPISEFDCGLTHAVRMAWRHGDCAPVVVTTQSKIDLHLDALDAAGLVTELVIKPNPTVGDMWGSVLLGMDLTMPGGLILPDSVAVPHAAISIANAIEFGCFVTTEGSRFSCLELTGCQPVILTKPQTLSAMLAWGVVTWDQDAARQLSDHGDHHDRAFESVMRDRGYGLFMLGSYHDLGSFKSYREYLNEHRSLGHVSQTVLSSPYASVADT